MEDVALHNEKSLKALVRAIRFSQGQFRLILVRCNYEALRDAIVQRLRELSPVVMRELVLPESVKSLYTTIKAQLGDEVPQALMVFGLESANDIKGVLTSSNTIREELSNNFPFPLVLWINDEVLQKLLRIAPDLESWATSFEFKLTTDELLNFLRQKTDEIFAGDSIPKLANCFEVEAACQDLQRQGQRLEPDLEASVEFIRGLDAFADDRIDEALEHYQKSLAFWQQSYHLERQGTLLLDIALCYYRKAEKNRAESRHYWQKSSNYLQQCLETFEQAQRLDLVAHHISNLGEVLQRLKAWEQLQVLAEKALVLHQGRGDSRQIAQDYGFLAEVALAQSNWAEANQFAQQALQLFLASLNRKPYEWALYTFLLARSQQHLDRVEEAISNLEQARQHSNPQYNPELYIDILGDLRSLYFEQGEYLKAFKIKQQQRLIEYQYNFKAFAGASLLLPKQQIINPALIQTSQQALVAQEIVASGRELDVRRLIERISSTNHKLIVIHGESGVGKSSILKAGLVPELKQQTIDGRDALPVLVRFYTNWLRELGRAIAEELEEVRDVKFPEPLDSVEAISEQLQKNDARNLLTVLIFDQFEELFFACKDKNAKQIFFNFLENCFNIGFVKIIFSLREDYIHYLLEIERAIKLDAISKNILDRNIRYHLGNFSPQDARAVIQSLTERSQFSLQRELIDALVEDLAGGLEEVRPIELQILGAQLQEDKITTLGKYRNLGEKPMAKLVERYLEGVIEDCGKENKEIALPILYLLTDENKTRPLKTSVELAVSLKLKADKLDLVLEILVGSGLVLRVPESPTERYQLVHDYLVAYIRQQQGAKLLEELRKRAEEFQVEQIDALSRYSDALFNQGKELEALIEGLRAAIPLQQVDGANADTRIRVLTALRQAVYSVREPNFLEGKFLEKGDGSRIISFSPDSKTIISASGDKTIQLWNSEGKLFHTRQEYKAWVRSISFSPDTKMIVSASGDKAIQLWNIEGKLLHTFQGHDATANSVNFSPDSKTIVLASGDKTIQLWSIEGKLLHTFQGHDAAVNSASFSHDGKTIASASRDKTIKLWSIEGKLLHTLQGHSTVVNSVNFSPDGKIIASASGDETIQLWSIEGKLLHTLQGHSAAVNSVSYSPDGKTIASTSWDKTIKLWNSEGKLLYTLQGHSAGVRSVSFSSNGKTIASTSWDKTIKLWNTEGKLLHTFQGCGAVIVSVSFSLDGKMLASASEDKTVILWNLDLEDLLVRGCNLLRDYSVDNPHVSESDRHLCDGIGTQK